MLRLTARGKGGFPGLLAAVAIVGLVVVPAFGADRIVVAEDFTSPG